MADSIPSTSETVDHTPCMTCEILYFQSHVAWYRCKNCKGWACADCAQCVVKKKKGTGKTKSHNAVYNFVCFNRQ